MMEKNNFYTVDNTALFAADKKFYGAAHDYFYSKKHHKIDFIRLKDLVLAGVKFSSSVIKLFCRAQQCALERKLPFILTTHWVHQALPEGVMSFMDKTSISALKGISVDDVSAFLEDSAPVEKSGFNLVKLDYNPREFMSVVVDQTKSVTMVGVKSLTFNKKKRFFRFKKSLDYMSITFEESDSVSIKKVKVLSPDCTVGSVPKPIETGISLTLEVAKVVDIKNCKRLIVYNGDPVKSNADFIELESSNSVKISKVDSISISSIGSGIVDELISPLGPKMLPGPEIFICVNEFEPVIRFAQIKANRCLSPVINEQHLLRAMLRRRCLAYNMFEFLGGMAKDNQIGVLKYPNLRRKVLQNLFNQEKRLFKGGVKIPAILTHAKSEALDKFTIDLTAQARLGKIADVIGRDAEIKSVARVLLRRSKNSAVLVGEPGTGKTAIAEGLALNISRGTIVPPALYEYRVLSFDLTASVAGSRYRGDFEKNIRSVINEVEKDGRIILFIDEIHTILGAGSVEGSLDAANILKPALARSNFRVLGATTTKEYRIIEKDAALARRFQRVWVNEPKIQDVIDLLRSAKNKYEEHHKVFVPDKLVKELVEVSDKYVRDRNFPDKAFDILDESCTQFKIKRLDDSINPAYLDKLPPLDVHGIEMERVEADIQRFTASLRYANLFGRNVVNKLMKLLKFCYSKKKYLENLKVQYLKENVNEQVADRPSLTLESIHKVISIWTDIPSGVLGRDEKEALLNLHKNIGKFVKGQPRAVDLVAKAVRRFRLGVKATPKPSGSFMFCGPTGVGKTELAKVVANQVFGGESALIRFDMSEYKEAFEAKKLLGAPPGYVGYDEGGLLTDAVRRKPYSVVLFDEIEKAHLSIYDLFLQVLDDGILTDNKGRKIYFRDTIIVMTSNIGANEVSIEMERFNQQNPDGLLDDQYNILKNVIDNELKNYFRPEFLNRIDHIVVFSSLSRIVVEQIAERKYAEFIALIKASLQIDVEISSQLKNYILEKGYQPLYGARPLRRTITELLEDPISAAILEKGDLIKDKRVLMDLKDPNAKNKKVIVDPL